MPVQPALEGRQRFVPGSAHCGGLRFDFAATPSVGLHRFANGQRPLGQMRTESRAGLISRHRTGHLGMIGLAAGGEKSFQSFQTFVATSLLALRTRSSRL